MFKNVAFYEFLYIKCCEMVLKIKEIVHIEKLNDRKSWVFILLTNKNYIILKTIIKII